MGTLDFGAMVWLHSDEGSRIAERVEILCVNGRFIGMDFLLYMVEHGDDPYVLERFSALAPETPYQVLGRYWWADGEFDLELTAWVECLIDIDDIPSVPESDLWEMFGEGGQVQS